MPSTPVTRVLDHLGVRYALHVHSGTVRSLQQAAEERGLLPEQIVRSLVFRLESGEFVLVLVAGPAKVSWPKLRRHLGASRLTTATPEEVLRITGYEPGAVSPFGLAAPLRLLADRGMLKLETVSTGAGMRNAGILMARADLLQTLQPEMGDFVA